MKKTVKKGIIAVLILTFLLSMTACKAGSSTVEKNESSNTTANGTGKESETTEKDSSKNYPGDSGGIKLPISEKPIEIEYMFTEHPNNPVNKDWLVFTELEKRTNVKYKLQFYGQEFREKLNLLAATRQLPDLIYTEVGDANRYGLEGAIIPVSKYLNKMPNFTKLLNENPKFKNDITADDGNIYICPSYGITRILDGWLYRRDLFKKNNLQPPKDFDELYQLLKDIKKAYPESYPFTHRKGINILGSLGSQFGTGFKAYYDFDTDQYKFGATDDNYKEMLMYLNRLHTEGLMDPEWASQNTKQWEDKITTSKSLVTYDMVNRIYMFNNIMREKEPEFDLFAFLPMKTKNGRAQVNARNELGTDFVGFMVSDNNKYPEETFKLIDYLYSEQGSLLTTFGIEGQTYYKDGNGKYNWSKDINSEIHPEGKKHHINDFGFKAMGTYTWTIDTSHLVNSKEWNEANDLYLKNNAFLPSAPKLAYNQEETRVLTGATSLYSFVDEQSMKFILGDRSFSEWDNYVEEVKKYGVDKLLKAYTSAYQRYKEKSK